MGLISLEQAKIVKSEAVQSNQRIADGMKSLRKNNFETKKKAQEN